MSGRLIAIARRHARRAATEEVSAVDVTCAAGIEGDHKGAKFPNRQVTILAIEDWHAALADLGGNGNTTVALPWTARRANLLVAGVELPRVKGAILSIGGAQVVITGQTVPCQRMNEVCQGLSKALHKAWRGGVTCRVLKGGRIAAGDGVAVLHAPTLRERRLP